MKPHHTNQLPVHIVEQHNDVVPFIHRAIASKKLPFSCVPIIHLDSHPDLLIPIGLDADMVFKPPELYNALSIENWLLPLAYAKHTDHVIWVKPPWANQIKASQQSFSIGKCSHSGKLRLSCKENYFLTDGLFCAPCDLNNSAECKLTVVELCPLNWKDLDNCPMSAECDSKETVDIGKAVCSFKKGNLKDTNHAMNEDPTLSKNNSPGVNSLKKDEPPFSKMTSESLQGFSTSETAKHDMNEDFFCSYEKWSDYLGEVTTKPFILDIDLDFFSTMNPFKELFEAEREILQRLFKCPPLLSLSDEDLETFTCLRQKQLEELEFLFTHLNEKWCENDTSSVPPSDELSNTSLVDLTGLSAEELEYFQIEEQKDLLRLCQNLLPDMKTREISFLQLFDYGCTLDETELPHHVSSKTQITTLMASFRSVVEKLQKPAIVTISRSSHDDYCPQHQVDEIQQMVLKILSDVFGSLDVTKNFDE